MSDDEPNFQIETEGSSQPVINLRGIPSKTHDVTISNKMSIKDDDSDATESIESEKSSQKFHPPPKKKPKENKVFSPQFDMYANPRKKVEDPSEYSDDDDDDDDDPSNDDDDYDDESLSEPSFAKKSGMSKLEEKIKKKEYYIKLQEAQESGYKLTSHYDMDSDLDDMKAEYDLYERQLAEKSLVEMFQAGFMAIIKGIEIMNGIYNPVGIKLKGLSDKVYDSKESLDYAFRRLAIKYSGGTDMPPELSILFILVGAVFTTHMSNSMLDNGPAMIEKLLPGFGNLMNQSTPIPQNVPSGEPQMRPPASDLSDIMSRLMPQKNLPFQAMGNPPPFPKSTSTKDVKPVDDSDRFSESSSIYSEETQNITLPSSNKSRRKKKTINIT